MRIPFYKLHLGGNSFILIDTENEKQLKLSEYPEFSKIINPDVKGYTIGIPKEYFGDGISQKLHDKTAAADHYIGVQRESEKSRTTHNWYDLP